MIYAMNYTMGIESELGTSDELELYYEARKDDEVSYTIDGVGSMGYDEALEYMLLDDREQDSCKAIINQCGENYFTTIADMLQEWENIGLDIIDGVSSDRELAYYLMFDINSDEEVLYSILKCDASSYEQLGSYINQDALASTISIECSVTYAGNRAFRF